MKHKKLFIALTTILSVVVCFAIFISVWYLGDFYPDFRSAEQEFDIPGLDEGAVPQGMGSCYANYTVETVKQETVTDENGNESVRDVVTTETKMQPYFFISAYMNDKSPSRIYVIGGETGYVGYVTLNGEDGEPFYGHCGGIAINNHVRSDGNAITAPKYAKYYTLWITCDSTVYVAKCSDAYANANKSIAQEIVEKAARIKLPSEGGEDENAEYDFSVKFTASFNANCRASFCYYYDDPYYGGSVSSITYDRLYVGEFYNGKKYKTDDSHKMTTPNGYENTAVMYEYNVATEDSGSEDKYNEYGLVKINNNDSKNSTDPVPEESRVPVIQKVFSLPEKIQGVAWAGRDRYGSNNGILILSQSYGLANSHLLCFDYKKIITNANRKSFSEINDNVNFTYEGIRRTSGNAYTDPSLNVYFVDKANREMFVDDLSIPSMSEALCNVTPPTSGNKGRTKFYVLFESGSKKYRAFVRSKTTNVYSLRFQRLDAE